MTSTTLLYSIPSCQYVYTFNSKPCSIRKGDRPRTIPTTIRALNLFDESGTGLSMRKRDNEVKDRGEDMCVCVCECVRLIEEICNITHKERKGKGRDDRIRDWPGRANNWEGCHIKYMIVTERAGRAV